eukprot:833235-Prymnesium_polylepis.1
MCRGRADPQTKARPPTGQRLHRAWHHATRGGDGLSAPGDASACCWPTKYCRARGVNSVASAVVGSLPADRTSRLGSR